MEEPVYKRNGLPSHKSTESIQGAMNSLNCIFVILALLAATAESHVFSKCDFAKELKKYKFEGKLEDWVYIAEFSSGFRTDKYDGPVNDHDTRWFGVYQRRSGSFYAHLYRSSPEG